MIGYSDSEIDIECYHCSGEGIHYDMTKDKNVICKTCDGTGYISNVDDERQKAEERAEYFHDLNKEEND